MNNSDNRIIVTAKMFKKPIKIASSNPLGGKDAKKVVTMFIILQDGTVDVSIDPAFLNFATTAES